MVRDASHGGTTNLHSSVNNLLRLRSRTAKSSRCRIKRELDRVSTTLDPDAPAGARPPRWDAPKVNSYLERDNWHMLQIPTIHGLSGHYVTEYSTASSSAVRNPSVHDWRSILSK